MKKIAIIAVVLLVIVGIIWWLGRSGVATVPGAQLLPDVVGQAELPPQAADQSGLGAQVYSKVAPGAAGNSAVTKPLDTVPNPYSDAYKNPFQ